MRDQRKQERMWRKVLGTEEREPGSLSGLIGFIFWFILVPAACLYAMVASFVPGVILTAFVFTIGHSFVDWN